MKCGQAGQNILAENLHQCLLQQNGYCAISMDDTPADLFPDAVCVPVSLSCLYFNSWLNQFSSPFLQFSHFLTVRTLYVLKY